MSTDFAVPTFANSNSNLAVNISPLGLVELSDEEFEVHGVRMSRYATQWAFYTGLHWTHRREVGEAQTTFNYFAAMTDYMSTFVFGRGVEFVSPKETEAIIPGRLKRIWEVDNDKRSILYEMAQQGGVSGDCFVKVAYMEPETNPVTGVEVPGRVVILPLNSSHAFPEWHPHEPNKFIRFKIKYKFWGQSPEGTRQVFSYTEIITDRLIQEFINDTLIRENENPLGEIPIVHIPNRKVSGFSWGLADCHDIITTNRLYNEIMTELADIINYHSSPVTVVTGAKAANLEKGAKKTWVIPNENARVSNLELGENLDGPLAYAAVLKISMHEMTGIPETALGQSQPISNTSGVALAIQFQPLMMKWHAKVNNYALGLERINAYALKTLFLKEPETLKWDSTQDPPLKEGQLGELNPADSITWRCVSHFPPPLPIDRLILLNEIQVETTMGLQSKRGALVKLGETEPDEKLDEIRQELREDALADGMLRLLRAQVDKEISELTGLMPNADGGNDLPPMDDSGLGTDAAGNTTGEVVPQMPQPTTDFTDILEAEDEHKIRVALVEGAYGTKLPQRRNPEQPVDGD